MSFGLLSHVGSQIRSKGVKELRSLFSPFIDPKISLVTLVVSPRTYNSSWLFFFCFYCGSTIQRRVSVSLVPLLHPFLSSTTSLQSSIPIFLMSLSTSSFPVVLSLHLGLFFFGVGWPDICSSCFLHHALPSCWFSRGYILSCPIIILLVTIHTTVLYNWKMFLLLVTSESKLTIFINGEFGSSNLLRKPQWPRGLRRRSAAARLLRLWVRIAPGAWIFVCCECCVLSGRGFCDELITRPDESYRLWCVVVCDLETSWMRRPCPNGGCCAKNKQTYLLRNFGKN